jgi:hypothetical protein
MMVVLAEAVAVAEFWARAGEANAARTAPPDITCTIVLRIAIFPTAISAPQNGTGGVPTLRLLQLRRRTPVGARRQLNSLIRKAPHGLPELKNASHRCVAYEKVKREPENGPA